MWTQGIGGPMRWEGMAGSLVSLNGTWMWHAAEVVWPPRCCPCGCAFDVQAILPETGGIACIGCGAIVTRAGQRFIPVATGEA